MISEKFPLRLEISASGGRAAEIFTMTKGKVSPERTYPTQNERNKIKFLIAFT